MIATRSHIIKTLLLILLSVNFVFAQNIVFKTSNFKSDKDGLKKALKNIKLGDEFLQSGNDAILARNDAIKFFEQALFFYLPANKFNPKNIELNVKIGNAYLYTNQKYLAYNFLQKAITLDDKEQETDPTIHFYYAMSLQLEGKFSEAIDQFNIFKKRQKDKKFEPFADFYKKHIQECESAIELIKKPQKVWIDNLALNSEADDWSPCLSADGELLIFTSNRANEHLPDSYGRYDNEIYYSTLENRKWIKTEAINTLNTQEDDAVGGLSYDGQRLLIYKVENDNADVFESKLNGTKWEEPERKMGKAGNSVNTVDNETLASYDPKDIKVYYLTDGGYGKNWDIMFSGVMNKERNIWGKGQSAGHEVNTKYHEGSVYLHPDGKTMYFSSQGHNSMGGYDIFVSHVDELGHWGPAQNLGAPINTPYDDLFYSSTASGKVAYIASNRKGGEGGMDIYKLTLWGTEKPQSLDAEEQLIASIANPIQDKTISQPVMVEERNLTVFKGKILDIITKEAVGANISITDNTTGKNYISLTSNASTGKFLISLPSGKNYGIAVSADGYLFHSENFDIAKGETYNLLEKDIELMYIDIGSKIALRNVFFEIGKSIVKEDSFAELDRLVDLMNKLPNLSVELSGHTDNTGSEVLNIRLSQKRAEAVVDYLIKKGISEDKLTAKGYGSTAPIDSNESLEGRKNNRRTEFKIIGN
ncbi:MAG: OmpA family protein [Bacteroidota bacterium]|nr:OmpA family protein [Bacteroidota bacterium]